MKKYQYRIIDFFLSFSRYNINLYSANASFFIVLSLFPAIMLILCLLPIFGFRGEDLIHAIQTIVPDVLFPLIERVIRDMEGNSTGFLLSASAIVAIWSSSKGVYSIQEGLNAIYGVKQNQSFFVRRAISIIYTLLFFLALVLTFVLLGFGRELARFFESKDVPILRFLAGLLQFRGLIVFTLLTLLFATIFCLFSNRKHSFRTSLPGAALAAFAWLLFTLAYSFYVRISGGYSVLYGSISIIAMGMFWLYTCITILFYGSVLNILLLRRFGKRKGPR